jgi:CheY-like chemotaxis protein
MPSFSSIPSADRTVDPLTADFDDLQALFIQNVAHELRTPLNMVQGYAYLLRDGSLGELSDEQRHAVFAIADYSDKLRRQVELIGTLLAVEARAILCQPLDLVDLADGVVRHWQAAAERAQLTIEWRGRLGEALVLGDGEALRQAVDCLLDNALKFTPAGGSVKVEVFAEPDWLCFAVADTGIGLLPDHLARIFVTRFYQSDGSPTRRYGGYGLGLTVVGAVVQALAGRVEVVSQWSQGSRFIIKLPALAALRPYDAPRLPVQRVLIVDDEPNVTAIIQAGLERLPGCEVCIAASGAEALRLFEREPFDLLITDYKMPDMDGLTLVARIRQQYPRTGLIVLTAYSTTALREQATELAVQHVLDKPVGLEKIRHVALEMLSHAEPESGR